MPWIVESQLVMSFHGTLGRLGEVGESNSALTAPKKVVRGPLYFSAYWYGRERSYLEGLYLNECIAEGLTVQESSALPEMMWVLDDSSSARRSSRDLQRCKANY